MDDAGRDISRRVDALQIRQMTIWLMLLLPAILLGAIIATYVAARGLGPKEPNLDQMVRAALPYLIALNHILVFSVLVLLLRRSKLRLRDIGWTLTGTKLVHELVAGLLAGLVLYLFKEFALDSLRSVFQGRTPTFTTLFRFRTADLDLPMAIASTVLVFIEESVYRGFGITGLRGRLGLPGAVVVSSLLFGLLHWGNGIFAIGATSVLGMLLAVFFLWRKNLVAPTIAHALYNIQVLLT